MSWNQERGFIEERLFEGSDFISFSGSLIPRRKNAILFSHCGLFWIRLSSLYICCTLGIWLIFCYMILERDRLQENFILLALGTGKESKNNVQLKYTSFFLPDAQDREMSPLSSRFPEYPWEWMSITAHETGSSKAAPG